MKRTLILGGGFGGLTVAHELAKKLGEAHEALIVDREPQFVMGLRKPWAVVAHERMEDGRRRRAMIEGPGIRFVNERIVKIDPAATGNPIFRRFSQPGPSPRASQR